MKVLVTGGAGFIGSAVVRHLLLDEANEVVNLDNLTYAANPETMAPVEQNPRYAFERVDVCDAQAVRAVLVRHQPDVIMHLAAESHVDRSIDGPAQFIQTNIVGTFVLLEEVLDYYQALPEQRRLRFRFHHVSTDEVFGSLNAAGRFRQDSPYAPRSPYSASKAASDHLVMAWHHTYGLPVVLSNCSNNYGPYQFPEKLIPLMIINGLRGEPMPVYGDGGNVRDWLYVGDHAAALSLILQLGRIGGTYLVGGDAERTNLEVVETICGVLDRRLPDSPSRPHRSLISFVADRPGHDLRYAIDASDLRRELGWQPSVDFEEGLQQTVEWYLTHRSWWEPLLGDHLAGERLGLGRSGQAGTAQ